SWYMPEIPAPMTMASYGSLGALMVPRSYLARVARDRQRSLLRRRRGGSEVREIVREVDQVLVGEAGQFLRHGAAVAQPRAALVVAHGLEEIVLALVGETWHLLAPGEIRIVADAARMAQGEPAAAREAGRVGRLLARRRWRKLATRSAKAVRSLLVRPFA